MIHARSKKQHLAVSLCLLASAAATAVQASEPRGDITAIWRVQQLEFDYRGHRTLYSCEALERKIASVLTAVGASSGLKVQLPCRAGGLTNRAVAVITMAAPIEATPENVRAATTYSTEHLLVARLNKISLPTENDLGRFPAQWQTVALHKLRNIDGGDCELLRALSTQVFPQLAVRAENRLSCPLASSARMHPKFVVTALVPAPDESVVYARQSTAD